MKYATVARRSAWHRKGAATRGRNTTNRQTSKQTISGNNKIVKRPVEVPERRGLRTPSRCHAGTPGRSLPPPPRPRPVAPDAQPETQARATPRRRLPNLTSPPTAEPTGPERFVGRGPRTSPGTAAVAHPRTNTAANCRDLAPPRRRRQDAPALAPPVDLPRPSSRLSSVPPPGHPPGHPAANPRRQAVPSRQACPARRRPGSLARTSRLSVVPLSQVLRPGWDPCPACKGSGAKNGLDFDGVCMADVKLGCIPYENRPDRSPVEGAGRGLSHFRRPSTRRQLPNRVGGGGIPTLFRLAFHEWPLERGPPHGQGPLAMGQSSTSV